MEVWVVETHHGHGEGAMVRGVYESREAAWEAAKALPNVKVYVDEGGVLRIRPKREHWRLMQIWGTGRPMEVRGRAEA